MTDAPPPSPPLSIRRKNRIAVIQFLFQWEMNPPSLLEDAVRQFLTTQSKERTYYAFAEELIRGVIEHREQIDITLRKHTQNWAFNRIAKVDLAILRLAVYELLFRADIPPVVTINEAIELGKHFSTAEAKRFINGILDRVKATLQRPFRQPATSSIHREAPSFGSDNSMKHPTLN